MSIQERARIRGVLAVPARVTLLDRLRASPQPLDAQALATATGLHMTTVRSHLDVLIEAGLVTTGRQQPPGRGRPRTLYAPSSAEARRRVTGLFAEMGFDPEPAVGGRILLHDCPFRDTARAHPEVVCRPPGPSHRIAGSPRFHRPRPHPGAFRPARSVRHHLRRRSSHRYTARIGDVLT